MTVACKELNAWECRKAVQMAAEKQCNNLQQTVIGFFPKLYFSLQGQQDACVTHLGKDLPFTLVESYLLEAVSYYAPYCALYGEADFLLLLIAKMSQNKDGW